MTTEQQIEICNECLLHKNRHSFVKEHYSSIILISFGIDEVQSMFGRSTVGKDYKAYTDATGIAGMGHLSIIKCPFTSDPTVEQIYICSFFIRQQLADINPDIVILNGRKVFDTLINVEADLKYEYHVGKMFNAKIIGLKENIKCYISYEVTHPKFSTIGRYKWNY